jgi:hypothetical protein
MVYLNAPGLRASGFTHPKRPGKFGFQFGAMP